MHHKKLRQTSVSSHGNYQYKGIVTPSTLIESWIQDLELENVSSVFFPRTTFPANAVS